MQVDYVHRRPHHSGVQADQERPNESFVETAVAVVERPIDSRHEDSVDRRKNDQRIGGVHRLFLLRSRH